MTLLLDIGNTRIKWATVEADKTGAPFAATGSVAHRDDQGVDWLAGIPGNLTAAAAVNVAGAEIAQQLGAALHERFSIDLQLLRTAPRCGELVNGYAQYEQLGADRWAAIVGAWFRCRERLCVVDAGTAVTIDMVEADGRHRGGVILPGLRLMAEALNRDTSDIEAFARGSAGPVADEGWYGKDTLSAVQRGAYFALQAAIRRAAEPAAGESAPRLILTGGDANALLPLPGVTVEHRSELVLEGVQVLSEAADA